MNFGIGILFKKGQKDTIKEQENLYSTGNLSKLLESNKKSVN